MTFDGRIGGNSGNNPIFFNSKSAKAGSTNKSSEIASSQPIDMVGSKTQIGRTDLDKLSPYAGILNISHKPVEGTPESYMAAAPELGRWQGDFKLSNDGVKELNQIFNTAKYICADSKEVAANLEKANFFNTLDKAFGIA
ncbi:MAG: hypothetical protein NC191_03150 [Muribaculaceae bacterium]|nr:hypothetical protein [Muribaculaceae bacterium]